MTESVPVTAEDREAAAPFEMDLALADAIRHGRKDAHPLVQAFARHRTAETERCAGIAEAYHHWMGSADIACSTTTRGITTAIRTPPEAPTISQAGMTKR